MQLEKLDDLMKSLRRAPLYGDGGQGRAVELGCADIEGLIPHRDPFLLVDSIDGIDLETKTIRGIKLVAETDPVFAGHFPGEPIYPGVLQVEMMGQLALCLARLADVGKDGSAVAPPRIRAIRIHHALYIEPVLPGDHLTVHAGIIDDTGMTAISAGQLFKGSTLCSCSVQEVCFVD